MTREMNRVLRVLYPTVVFLGILAAFSKTAFTSGEVTHPPIFSSHLNQDQNSRSLASAVPACEKDHLTLPKDADCKADDSEAWNLIPDLDVSSRDFWNHNSAKNKN